MIAVRSTLEAMAEHFNSALCPEEIFGNLPGPAPEQLATLKLKGRNFSKSCHPDLALAADKALATEVFQALFRWEEVARQKVEIGTYGDYLPHHKAPPYESVEFLVRNKPLTLTGLIAEGIFASVHSAEYEDEAGHSTFVKCARVPHDNDLLEREFEALRTFQVRDAHTKAEAFFQKQRVYAPRPLTSFFIRDEAGLKCRANALRIPQGRCFTAETLLRDKFPGGIEPKHVWWIFRRLLLTLWMAHLKGYVHGAVTPDHVLVFPEEHGIVLLDWTCAAKIDEEHIPALNPAYEQLYPPETAHKALAMPSTDIFLAASTAITMLGGDAATGDIPASVPPAVRQALQSCLNPIARYRPQDAEQFHNEFGALLGKREYAHLVVP